jgi:hypothetical protein
MNGNPFHRSTGGTISRINIVEIVTPTSLEEVQLQFLSHELSKYHGSAKAWRCSGLLADGIVLVDGVYYLVELKSSMYWSSLTSAIVQLVSSQILIPSYLKTLSLPRRKELGIDSDLNGLKMLIAFSEFKDWENCNNGWGQLCKHLNEFPNSQDIGVIQTNFVKGISFPP